MSILPLPMRLRSSRWQATCNEIVRLIKYALVGSTNTVVSLITLNLFFFLYPPASTPILVLGSSVAYLVGDINSYFWNNSWTFDAGKPSWRSFWRFAVMTVIAMVLNAIILWNAGGYLLNSFLPTWASTNLSQVSGLIAGSLGYLVCRFWVFNGSIGSRSTQVLPSTLLAAEVGGLTAKALPLAAVLSDEIPIPSGSSLHRRY